VTFEDLLHPYLGAYTRSPQWLKSTVGWAYARLPKRVRLGADHAQWEQLAAERRPEVLAREARERLARTLQVALGSVPAYRTWQHLLPRVEHEPEQVLAELPLVDKTDIKRDEAAYLAEGVSPNRRLEAFTGGSTTHPMRFHLERHVTRTREYGFMADFHARVGYTDDDRTLALRGRSVPSAATGGALWMYEPIKRQLILSSDHLAPPNMPQYVQAIRRWRPSVIQAFPSALYPLAKWLALHPTPDVTERIKGVLLYSETIHDHQFALFERVFGCPVLRHYGHSERGVMAASIPGDDRYFFWPQYGHLELVDEQGRPVTEPGQLGEIVCTSFDNAVMPFVRYRTGDLGQWSARPNAALPGFPVLERIEGRLQEMVQCHDGRLISITTLGAAHFDQLAEVTAIQYEQERRGHVRLKVQTAKPLGDAVRREIERAVRDKTQGGCEVEVVEVAQIARTRAGKQLMLVQHLDIAREFGAPDGAELASQPASSTNTSHQEAQREAS
jgi:phenylacetate-CoA ligase